MHHASTARPSGGGKRQNLESTRRAGLPAEPWDSPDQLQVAVRTNHGPLPSRMSRPRSFQWDVEAEPVGACLGCRHIVSPLLPAGQQPNACVRQADGGANRRRRAWFPAWPPALPPPAAARLALRRAYRPFCRAVMPASRKSEADAELPPRRSNPPVQAEPAPGPYSPPSPTSRPRGAPGSSACACIQRRPIPSTGTLLAPPQIAHSGRWLSPGPCSREAGPYSR